MSDQPAVRRAARPPLHRTVLRLAAAAAAASTLVWSGLFYSAAEPPQRRRRDRVASAPAGRERRAKATPAPAPDRHAHVMTGDPTTAGLLVRQPCAGHRRVVLLAVSVALGLAMSGRLGRRPGLPAKLKRFHEASTLVTLGLVVAHAGVLLADGYLRPGARRHHPALPDRPTGRSSPASGSSAAGWRSSWA